MIPSTTAYMTTHNDCFIIIKNVPCLKCDQCGEEYIDGSTLMKIESIIEKFRFVLTEIAIVDFSNAA
jgi:YgiT-type zinc finger domain-containing protein